MKKTLATIGSTVSYLSFAGVAFAQQLGTDAPVGGIKNFPKFIGNAVTVALIIAGILIFIYLVWGGLQWMTSGGDKQKVEDARSKITNALIGLAIVAAAYALAQIIANFLGTGTGLGSSQNLPSTHLQGGGSGYNVLN